MTNLMNDGLIDVSEVGIITFDFHYIFPHFFWISNWVVDVTYPKGVCYKILSVRDEAASMGELVLIRTFRDGTKEILHRARVPLNELQNAASIFVDGLSKKLDVNFEEQDYRMAKTIDEFKQITTKYGWVMNSKR